MTNEKTMKEPNRTRSATAPETMVAAVPAKTSWKKNFAQSGTPVQLSAEYTPLYASPVAGLPSAPPRNQSPCVPNSGVPSPNMMPKPTARKAIDETANTTKFFARIVTVFLARQKPDSTEAKPRFMKNTRNAVASTHTVSTATLRSVAFASRVLGGAAAAPPAAFPCASAAPPAVSIPPTSRAATAPPHHPRPLSATRRLVMSSTPCRPAVEKTNGAHSGAIGRRARPRRRARSTDEQAACRRPAHGRAQRRWALTDVAGAGGRRPGAGPAPGRVLAERPRAPAPASGGGSRGWRVIEERHGFPGALRALGGGGGGCRGPPRSQGGGAGGG